MKSSLWWCLGLCMTQITGTLWPWLKKEIDESIWNTYNLYLSVINCFGSCVLECNSSTTLAAVVWSRSVTAHSGNWGLRCGDRRTDGTPPSPPSSAVSPAVSGQIKCSASLGCRKNAGRRERRHVWFLILFYARSNPPPPGRRGLKRGDDTTHFSDTAGGERAGCSSPPPLDLVGHTVSSRGWSWSKWERSI